MNTVVSSTKIRLALLLCWLFIVFNMTEPWSLIAEYAQFIFLGVVGAVFANSTGAGGGVVFVPFFNQLGLAPDTIVATSFAIQCCGMTAGALTWWHYYTSQHQNDLQWSVLKPSLVATVPFSLLGIMTLQWIDSPLHPGGSSDILHMLFGLFSIVLALAIYASVPLMSRREFRHKLDRADIWALVLVALFGGAITAWLSVGVGELVAVYLIMRGFNITMAIATAVILSAFSVWGGVLYHLISSQAVYWPIVLFAGAGAIVGGMLAKYVVLFFSARNLKVFFATWVMVLGVTGLPLF